MFDLAPVVSAVCEEPKGDVVRYVRPMLLTIDNLREFWNHARKFRVLFADEIDGDFKKFLNVFLSRDESGLQLHGLIWVIDDFKGVFYMNRITNIDASVHYSFFDGRHTGREHLTRSMIQYVFNTYGFRRLNTEIPLYAKRNVFGFVSSLGFRKEGRRRSCRKYKGEWFDEALFGILKDEVETWDLTHNTKK